MFQVGVNSTSKLVGQLPYWDMPNYKDLDLYFDATREGYKNKPTWGGSLASLITDTHGDGMFVSDGLSGWSNRASNILSKSSAGVQTVPSRTNFIINNTLNSGSGISLIGTTLAANTPGDSPAYDNNAKRVTQGSGASDTVGRTGLVCTADTYYTFSQSFKYDASTVWVRVVFSDNVANGWQCWINLQTKAVGTFSIFGAAAVSTPKIVLEPNGWFRLELSGKCTAAVASGTMATVSVTGDAANTRAAGTYMLWVPNFELGTFATPPIITGATAVTRSGNIQLITGLGTLLSVGVAGFVKFNALASIPEGRVLNFTDSGNVDQVQLKRFSDGTRWRFVGVDNGSGIGNLNTNAVGIGQTTLVFAFSGNYINVRYVGDTPVGSAVPTAWPVMDRLAIGGHGIGDQNNSYQLTQKVGLKFGAQNQASFDAMYAIAAAA